MRLLLAKVVNEVWKGSKGTLYFMDSSMAMAPGLACGAITAGKAAGVATWLHRGAFRFKLSNNEGVEFVVLDRGRPRLVRFDHQYERPQLQRGWVSSR